MPVKHFIVSPGKVEIDKASLAQRRLDEAAIHKEAESARERANRERLAQGDELKHLPGRVVVKVNVESKNQHRLTESLTIRRERQYNNFNRRETEPVNCVVISSEYVPTGAEILVGHNALHETNKILDYTPLCGAAESSDIRYYSLPEDDCFAWRNPETGRMEPMKGYQFGLRIFEPYDGIIGGIAPTLVKDKLYVTTGDLAGQVVGVLTASDYQIVFQGVDNREDTLIRFRHSDTEELEREEVIYIDHEATGKVKSGEFIVGYEIKDAKAISNAD